MYIGPWQEYKLSQANRPQQGLTTNNRALRDDLQKTLMQTLDPASVAKVMEAMNPLLAGRAAGAEDGMNQSVLPPLSSARRHQGRRPARRAAEKPNPTLHEQFKLPSIHTQYRTDAPSPGQHDTPHSVRSSKSEPLHSSRVPRRPQNDIRAFSPPVNSARSTGYNPSNLVATLRLERRSRPTLNDAAKRSDFGQFWSWKKDGSDAGSDVGSLEGKKKKADTGVENKLSQIRNMQKLYTSGKQDQYIPPPLEPISVDVDASPLKTYKKPQTPVVEDRDLTSTDLAVVSKYFSGNRPSASRTSDFEPHQKFSSPKGRVAPLVSSPVDEGEEIGSANDRRNNAEQPADDADSPRGRIICSPVQVMDTPIGGNFSSPDGLLHWTSLLNPDEIDAMY